MLRQTPAAVRFLSCEPLLGPISPAVVAGMDWVIAGGESGPRARRSDERWFRDLVAASRVAGVAVFVKQLGFVLARERGLRGKADALDDLPADLRIREYPCCLQRALARCAETAKAEVPARKPWPAQGKEID